MVLCQENLRKKNFWKATCNVLAPHHIEPRPLHSSGTFMSHKTLRRCTGINHYWVDSTVQMWSHIPSMNKTAPLIKILDTTRRIVPLHWMFLESINESRINKHYHVHAVNDSTFFPSCCYFKSLSGGTFSEPVVSKKHHDLIGVDEFPWHKSHWSKWYLCNM